MVSIKTAITLGVAAVIGILLIANRRAVGETGQFLGQGLSSVGSGISGLLGGLGSGLGAAIRGPISGIAGGLTELGGAVRYVPAQAGLPFGGIAIGEPADSPIFGGSVREDTQSDTAPPVIAKQLPYCLGLSQTNCQDVPRGRGGIVRGTRSTFADTLMRGLAGITRVGAIPRGFATTKFDPTPSRGRADRTISLTASSYERLRARGLVN